MHQYKNLKKAKKCFGQHFLHDIAIINNIIDVISLKKNDIVAEIGPGLGALTTHLLPHLDKLHVVEIDRDVIPNLIKNCKNSQKLIIHEKDVLKFDFNSLIQDNQKLRLVGNLPYNISTELLFHLFNYIENIEDMVFMFQKEVAERITAIPGSSNYGRLSVMCQYFCNTQKLFNVSPEAFNPKPKVESAVIKLIPKKERIKIDIDLFGVVVKQAFSMRRKTIQNSLKPIMPSDVILKSGISPSVRAQEISLEQYACLTNSYFKANK